MIRHRQGHRVVGVDEDERGPPFTYAEAKRFYERNKARANSVVAIKALAHKLARACFHILKERKVFGLTRCFA